MKAHLVVSTEYRGNQPSVFLMVDGKYYGEMTYPKLRKFPKKVDYWHNATSSDTDRGFAVYPVELTRSNLDKIIGLSNEIEHVRSKRVPYFSVRDVNYLQKNIAISEKNKPCERVESNLSSRLQSLLLSFK